MDLVHPDDVERSREELKRNQRGSGTRTFENRYRCRDGSWRWLSWNSSVDTETGLIYGVARDVTTRIEVAEALRKSEERYRTLVESARDAILTLGPDGTIRSANQAFETITGWKEEEWLGRSYEEILHPHDRALAREMFGKLGRDEAMPVFEVKVMAAEGAHTPVEVTVAAFEPEPGERWALLVGRDIRSRKALDERLQRIQRLDAVGRLAAGVAHDFRNVLTVVRGEAELLAGEEDLSQEVEDGVRQIRVAAEQGVDLTERLLGLSRKRHVPDEPGPQLAGCDARGRNGDDLHRADRGGRGDGGPLPGRTSGAPHPPLGERYGYGDFGGRPSTSICRRQAEPTEGRCWRVPFSLSRRSEPSRSPGGTSWPVRGGRLRSAEGAAPPDGS